MQHDLLTPVQQDAERGAQQKNGNVRRVAVDRRRDGDRVIAEHMKAGDPGHDEQERVAAQLPRRSLGDGIVQRLRRGCLNNPDVGRGAGIAGRQSGQVDLAGDAEPCRLIEIHG